MLSGFPKFMNTFQKGRIERLVQLGEVGRQSLQVPTLKLAEHLLNNGVTTPDLVCVDVEGAEWSIVMDLCNNGVTPRAFCIENNELHYLLCYEMYKRGYELAAVKGGDEIYVR